MASTFLKLFKSSALTLVLILIAFSAAAIFSPKAHADSKDPDSGNVFPQNINAAFDNPANNNAPGGHKTSSPYGALSAVGTTGNPFYLYKSGGGGQYSDGSTSGHVWRSEGLNRSEEAFELFLPTSSTGTGAAQTVTFIDACKTLADNNGWEDHRISHDDYSAVGGNNNSVTESMQAWADKTNVAQDGSYGVKGISSSDSASVDTCDGGNLTVSVPDSYFQSDPRYLFWSTAAVIIQDTNGDGSKKNFSVQTSSTYVEPLSISPVGGANTGSTYDDQAPDKGERNSVNLFNPSANYFYDPAGPCNFSNTTHPPNCLADSTDAGGFGSMNQANDSTADQCSVRYCNKSGGVNAGATKPGYPVNRNTFDFYFRTDCEYQGEVVHLKWARGNEPSQTDGAESWTLYDVSNGNSVVKGPVDPTFSGYGDPASQNVGSLAKGDLYKWEWNGVDAPHGVTVFMPFSQFTATSVFQSDGCPQPSGRIYDVSTACNSMSIYGFDDLQFTRSPYQNVQFQVYNAADGTDIYNNTLTRPTWLLGLQDPGGPTGQGPMSFSVPYTTLEPIFKAGGWSAKFYLRILDPLNGVWYWVNDTQSPTYSDNSSAPSNMSFTFNRECAYIDTASTATNCVDLSVVAPMNYKIRFDQNDGTQFSYGPYAGSTSEATYHTFPDFPDIRPHYSYTIDLLDTSGNQLDSKPLINSAVTPNSPYCMSAKCETNIVFTPSGTQVEPGEHVQATYGVQLINYTGKTFTDYNVKGSSASGGLVINGTNPITTNFSNPPGTQTNMDGPWDLTANYQGTLHAALQYQSTDISSVFGLNCTSDPYTPETRPYVDFKNGDINAGGGFQYQKIDASNNETIAQCNASEYPRFESPYGALTTGGLAASKANYIGGIRTFGGSGGMAGAPYGSSADFAAYALGLIDGSSTSPNNYGFYSDAFEGGTNYNKLTFANSGDTLIDDTNNLGGLLGGSAGNDASNVDSAAHCAPDYYDETQLGNLTDEGTDPTIVVNGLGSQQYKAASSSGGCVNIDSTGNVITQTTIYVQGNVCINNNIQYGNWTFDNTHFTNDAPYLTIITKGNIYIQSNVSQIAGFFIAQPQDSDGSDGKIYTCASGANATTPAQEAGICHSGTLTVNGAIAAQHVYLTRSIYSLVGNDAGPPAETFNFIPSIVLGQPELKSLTTGTSVPYQVDASYNLPPVF